MDSQSSAEQAPTKRRGHIIVVGNEKGGSGKTTTCVHLVVALLRLGFRVGSMDIDARQRSLTRYLENRRQTMSLQGTTLPMPSHAIVNKSPFDQRKDAEADERDRFTRALAKLLVTCDFVVIDSPGNDTNLARTAHSFADTVITPINDSFVDLDVLAAIDGQTLKIQKPSIYSEMLWEQKMLRAKRDSGSIDWIVMRNRLSNLDARNKRMITRVMGELQRRLGFRVSPGFSERVIYREMFLLGLTVLDVMDTTGKKSVSMSHIAARQEVRDLLRVLRIARVEERIHDVRTGQMEAPEAPAPAPTIEEPSPTEAANDAAPSLPAANSA